MYINLNFNPFSGMDSFLVRYRVEQGHTNMAFPLHKDHTVPCVGHSAAQYWYTLVFHATFKTIAPCQNAHV